MYARHATNAYARVGLETGVMDANPYRLIAMLFEGARAALATAQFHLRQGNIAAKGEAISKAISIIGSGLKASLDIEAGGDIADQLAALYDYMTTQLLHANLNNDAALLSEVDALLDTIGSAWQAIGQKPDAPAQLAGVAA